MPIEAFKILKEEAERKELEGDVEVPVTSEEMLKKVTSEPVLDERSKEEKAKETSRKRMRNLLQYRFMSDVEFNEAMDKKEHLFMAGITIDKDFEDRIKLKLDEFGKDYDIEDLNSNDMLVLRELAQAMITLEDYEHTSYIKRKEGISFDTLLIIEKLADIMSGLRGDISRLQTDLNITRKVRKTDKEASVIDYLADLKKKAKEFYQSKMDYVFCDKCNELLFTGWFLYPEEFNKITLSCHRILANGEPCGNKITIHSKELLEKRGSNSPEIMPDSMR